MSREYLERLLDDHGDAGGEVPRKPAPGKVTLTQHIPVQRRGNGDARPVRKAEPVASFGFVQAYGGDVKAPAGAAFPDEAPASWLGATANKAWRDAFDFDFSKPVQRAAATNTDLNTDAVHGAAARGLEAPASPLPHLDQIQKSFGHHDVSHVQAHVGGAAAEASTAMGASAYATGNDVAFASTPDLHTAAHEAAHVIQQKGGVQLKGGVGEADDTYEQHADAVADKVVAGESAEALLDQMAAGSSSQAAQAAVAVQRRGRGTPAPPAGSQPSEDHDAFMTVRAYDGPGGTLIGLWSGGAYFTRGDGGLPASFTGRLEGGVWRWTGDGGPVDRARLKVNSDKTGQSGAHVEDWAPKGARIITVDSRSLDLPFGAGRVDGASGDILPGARTGMFKDQPASGSEAPSHAADAPTISGPAASGVRRFDDLEIIDHQGGTTIQLGDSHLEIGRNKGSYYSYQIEPQASPRQRVVRITATVDTFIKHSPGIGPVELVAVTHYVERPIDSSAAKALGSVAAAPEVSASGDWWRVTLRMGRSIINIQQEDLEGRFAYFVDPEWSGEERTVHIVATPGVRVDDFVEPGLGAAQVADQRRLIANTIRVQDARLVPNQGTTIDPAQFLGVVRHESKNERGNPGGFTVATGTSGVTVRDLSLGATLTLRTKDPSRGARYLHDVDGRTFRALVGPGVSIDIVETRPMDPETPFSGGNQTDDFQNVEFLLYQARNDEMPPPGTPLTKDVLERYGEPRKPDSHQIAPIPEWLENARFKSDLASAAPGVGDAADYLDFFLAVSKGENQWGEPISFGETLLVGLCAVLPLLSYGAIRAGRRLAKFAKAAKGLTALGKLAARIGRSEPEVEAILAGLRRLDPEAQSAAKRIQKAMHVGDNIDPRDWTRLNEGLEAIGARAIPLDSPRLLGPGPAGAVRMDAVADAAAHAPGAPSVGGPSELLAADRVAAKQKELETHLGQYVRTMGAKKQARGVRVEVVDARTFKARYGNTDKARAKFTLTDRGPLIVARIDAMPRDMLDEAAHIAQLGDAEVAGKIRSLGETNMSDWTRMSAADRLEFYQTKLDVEIDAKRRALSMVKRAEDRVQAQAALEALEQHQREIASIEPDRLARLNSGEEAMPDFLESPAHLFGKERRVDVGTASQRTVDGRPVHGPAREVSRTKGDSDYSPAYKDNNVSLVLQHGHTWTESVHVFSGYDGKIASRTMAADGTTTIVVAAGKKKRQSYVLEAGSKVDPRWVPGASIKNGETLGVEPSMQFRRVQVSYTDGTSTEWQEYRSASGWAMRGEDRTVKGEIGEAAARAQADADLAAKKQDGRISGSVRIPHQNPNSARGGFDDVIVEFTGEGDDVVARIRIREVKNYDRTVPLADFTALRENRDVNLKALSDSVDEALEAMRDGLEMPGVFKDLSPRQVNAIRAKLDLNEFDVEVVLGPNTKLGAPGHHASTTLPALEGELNRRVTVERLADKHYADAAAQATPHAADPKSKSMSVGDRPHDAPPVGAHDGATIPGPHGDEAPHVRRGGPYKEPTELRDWSQPTRTLADDELLESAQLAPKMNGRALEKPGSFAIGKTLSSADQGHLVLDLLAKGDTSAFHVLAIHDVPKKFDAMRREWALVQTRDGFVVFAGEPGKVMLPNHVRVVGHTHPRFRPDAPGKEAKLNIPDDHPGIEIKDLVGQERMGLEAGLIPSADDIPNIADGTDHILHTRFVQTHDGKIANPADEMGLESRSRVKVHVTHTRVIRYNPQQNLYYYASEIDYRVDGKSIWSGTLFTKAGQNSNTGTRQVTLYMPNELAGPLPKGWIEP